MLCISPILHIYRSNHTSAIVKSMKQYCNNEIEHQTLTTPQPEQSTAQQVCFDELWPGGPRFLQSSDGFKLGTDSVLLAHFANTARVKRCIDLGSGAGVLTVLLCEKNKKLQIEGVEIQAESAELSRRNLEANGLTDRAVIHHADLREHRQFLEAGIYDLVVSNPPYFAENSGKSAPVNARAIARDERSCSLTDLCTAAGYLCRWGGNFAVVHRPERLSELFCAMTRAGIEPKRLRMVCHRSDTAPSLVLVEGRRGGKPGLTIEAPLVLTRADGSHSDIVLEIYHRTPSPDAAQSSKKKEVTTP